MSDTMNAARLAERAWRRIQRKPARDNEGVVGIQLKRDGVLLDRQTVRIDVDSSASFVTSEAGMGAVRKLTILGVKGHATLPDTDILKGDRVVLGSTEYKVMSVNDQQVGQVEAYCEAVS